MKKFLKISAYILGGAATVIIVFLLYFNASYPKVDPPSSEKVDITPSRIGRGEYLANHVSVCMDCHSTRDWSKFSGPPIPGTLGKGGDRFDESNTGVPGTVFAKNITPASLKDWTDGELIRAITCGVNKDGKAFFPLMPYFGYNNLTQEDLYSIVAYVRFLQPIVNEVPETELDFPVSLIVKTLPLQTYNPSKETDRSNTVEYGKYLVTIAGCFDCHTQQVKGEFIMEKSYAGGFEFNLPGGVLQSANITPDINTGIGNWTKEQFISRFKTFDPQTYEPVSTGMNDFNTIMPWTMYAGMTEEDLGAIFDYLKTVKPVYNSVALWSPNKK